MSTHDEASIFSDDHIIEVINFDSISMRLQFRNLLTFIEIEMLKGLAVPGISIKCPVVGIKLRILIWWENDRRSKFHQDSL
jgi:hypothetical protein